VYWRFVYYSFGLGPVLFSWSYCEMPTQFSSRVWRSLSLRWTPLLLLVLTGCDKIPTWGELTNPPAPEPVVVQPAPPPAPVAPPSPPPPSAEEIIAEFRQIPNNKITDEDLAKLATADRGLEGFESLNLQGSKVTNAGMASLKKLPNLKSITVTGTMVNNDGLASIAEIPTLERLEANGNGVKDTGISALKAVPGLRVLFINNAQLTPEGFAALGDLSNLEELHIGDTTLSDATFSGIAALPNLKSLHIHRCGVSDKSMGMLTHLKEIRELDIGYCPINGNGLLEMEKAGSFDSIHTLSVVGCPLNQSGAKAISQMTSLEVLLLAHITVGDKYLALMLKPLKKLRVLHCNKLDDLTDDSLLSLKGLTNLEELQFMNNKAVSGKNIGALKTLKKLERLNTSGTPISLDALRSLQKVLPDLKISSEVFR
jgi:Leucine-rich repeat (LRR) protein